MKTEMFFWDEHNDEHCYPLDDLLILGWDRGLDEITLHKALLDNTNPDYVYCTYEAEVADRNECSKKRCAYYKGVTSKNTGICKHRGNLYTQGEARTFKTKQP